VAIDWRHRKELWLAADSLWRPDDLMVLGVKLMVPKFSSAGSDTSHLNDAAFVVESEFERDVAVFASSLARYRSAGASEAMCRSTLAGTGLRLIALTDASQRNVDMPRVGAVVSGSLSISYYLPRRRLATPQEPVLSKRISGGSSFFISQETDAVCAAAPDTWLLVREGMSQHHLIWVDVEEPARICADLASLSHAELLKGIGGVDFTSISGLVASAGPLLAEIASRRDLLRTLISAARTDPGLRSDCELLSEFHKYVLHRAPNDTRLRLHLFRPDADLHAHAHRWAMVSHVLSGPVANKYYCTEGEVASSPKAFAQKAHITHRLQTGSCYAFGDALIHWFRGAPGTATLTLRGPAVKPSAMEFRRSGLTPKFSSAAKMEASLTMTAEQFEYGVRHLEMANVL
jgi:hypothetical protein